MGGVGMWERVVCVGAGATEESSAFWVPNSGTSHPSELRKQPGGRGGPMGGTGLQFSAGDGLQLQRAPLSLGTVAGLSKALVGAVICISFYGFIFALFISPCFPRVCCFGVNVSFEYFSITLKREGVLPPLLFYSR